jgi:hypothetical protein
VPSLDLALCLWVIGSTAGVRHALIFQVIGEIR